MANELDAELKSLAHLKLVSKIKHEILGGYVPSWALILGRFHKALYLIDCFAGPGQYECEGSRVDGSPVIAVKAGMEYAKKHPDCVVGVLLVDDDANQLGLLSKCVDATKPHPKNLKVATKEANSHEFIPSIVTKLKERAAPAFILVDPYGHPLSVSTMNELLSRPRTELLINLMWYRINMNLANPSEANNVNQLFGCEGWKEQTFMSQSGMDRERSFLKYFRGRLNAKYVLPFRIRFDKEDRISGSRTKYYLLHASNSAKAVLLMKEVMWPLGDEEGTFEFAGDDRPRLISMSPSLEELRTLLHEKFGGQEATFDEIRTETWDAPFIEKQYRSLLQQMRANGEVAVTSVSSKRSGLKEMDKVRFSQ
jgi:three-Cys-motif partner protein